MLSLDAAQRRLDHALRRVEAAASERARRAGGTDSSALGGASGEGGVEGDGLFESVTQLRDECGRLNDALDAARRENAALRRTNEEVARRLDGTIDELQQFLEA